MRTPSKAKIDLVDIISDLAPWLTPIPSAVLVANATVRHLAWAEPVGWVAGLIVEMLGISTVDTTMRYYNFNQEKRQSDAALPWILPAALVGVYLAATIILTVLLDTVPLLARWSPVIFPILALVGAINLVLRRNYRYLIRRIESEREQMRSLRRAAATAKESELASRIQPPADIAAWQQAPAPTTISRLDSRNPKLAQPLERFICEQCVREFGSRNALNAHLRYHRNGRQKETQPSLIDELDI